VVIMMIARSNGGGGEMRVTITQRPKIQKQRPKASTINKDPHNYKTKTPQL